ncbi:hypothetical protein BFJ72_g9891 [Fusarium proliferatum]|uniref:Uncharacterized protein n=1 Tax=Gibberella intermedia TaxID=948311 RepID=A0A420SWL4_GIBIN|nr:hypothetical protein BFJ72_g9891 [Fusarium proliferatum]
MVGIVGMAVQSDGCRVAEKGGSTRQGRHTQRCEART